MGNPTLFEMGSPRRPDPVTARIVTSGERIVCGFKGCEEVLLVFQFPSPQDIRARAPFLEGFRVSFPSAAGLIWVPDADPDGAGDGHFRYVAHARSKQRRDEKIATGHRWVDARVVADAQRRLSTGDSRVATRPVVDDYGHPSHKEYVLGNGMRIECPRCRRINTVPEDASAVAEARLRNRPDIRAALEYLDSETERLVADRSKVLAEHIEAGRVPRPTAYLVGWRPRRNKLRG